MDLRSFPLFFPPGPSSAHYSFDKTPHGLVSLQLLLPSRFLPHKGHLLFFPRLLLFLTKDPVSVWNGFFPHNPVALFSFDFWFLFRIFEDLRHPFAPAAFGFSPLASPACVA